MQHFFCTYRYLFELIFCIINIWRYFTQFFNKFLKFEEMEYLIHHVKVEMLPTLCKVPILFSAVKFKLGHKFSQFIYRFKIGSLKFKIDIHPVNSIFSVVVWIYNILVIVEVLFFLFPTINMKNDKVSFFYFLVKHWNNFQTQLCSLQIQTMLEKIESNE